MRADPRKTNHRQTDILDKEIEQYKIFREYITHEDNLINQRLSWILSIHGFLYAAYALTIHKKFDFYRDLTVKMFDFLPSYCKSAPSALYWFALEDCGIRDIIPFMHDGSLYYSRVQMEVLIFLIGIVGMCISLTGMRSIRAAETSLTSLREIYEATTPRHTDMTAGAAQGWWHRRWSTDRGERSYYTLRRGGGLRTPPLRLPALTGGGSSVDGWGFMASRCIPPILCLGWVVALVVQAVLLIREGWL